MGKIRNVSGRMKSGYVVSRENSVGQILESFYFPTSSKTKALEQFKKRTNFFGFQHSWVKDKHTISAKKVSRK